MERSCVFCGSTTKLRSSEHILPQWLIKETGNPNRVVSFGLDWNTLKTRQFAFDQLKFPACLSCNNDYSLLEEQAKQVIFGILNDNALSANDFDFLLTWLDKVRIGLWLGYRLLNRNAFGITPCFFIKHRIRNKDRAVLIFKADDIEKGLACIGVNTPFFAYSPTCFGLIIHDTYFINVSSDFLLSRRLGLPYPVTVHLIDSARNALEVDMSDGLERIIEPLFRISYDRSCTEIYQPIIPADSKYCLSWDMYKSPYVKLFYKNSRIGKLLIKIPHRKIADYPLEKTIAWIPQKKHRRSEVNYQVNRTIFMLHKYLIANMPLLDHLKSKDEIRFHKKNTEFVKKSIEYFSRRLDKELKPKY